MENVDYSFQDEAIKNICDDFKTNLYSKLLLVIPTGGGKTLTAIRTINKLIKDGFIKPEEKILWVCHRIQLKAQTTEVINNYKNKIKFNFCDSLSKTIHVELVTNAKKLLNSEEYKFVIIDEAHHCGARGYDCFFTKKIGVLGLTATPTRNDDKELKFEKVSYSISFLDLIKKNVILKPIFHDVNTNITVNADDEGSSLFNTTERNNKIAEIIFERTDIYKKVIVFVSTNKHVEDLWATLKSKNESLGLPYNHIGFIHSLDNDLKLSTEDYLNYHKSLSSSILINCKILNEGYDDPSINTVVMGVPTKSVLYYVQCVGRVVRSPKQNWKDVYVLDLFDDHLNMKYRINNLWLFSDISDSLEPIVIEQKYKNPIDFNEKLNLILKKYNVEDTRLNYDIYNNGSKFSLLVFNYNRSISADSVWKILPIGGEDYYKYINIYNSLSNNISSVYNYYNRYLFDILKVSREDTFFSEDCFVTDLVTALKHADNEIISKEKVERLKYFLFSKIDDFPDLFLKFIDNCINKNVLKKNYDSLNPTGYVFKMPLVFGGFEGCYVSKENYEFILNLICDLEKIKNYDIKDQNKLVFAKISSLNKFPIDLKFILSIIYLVKFELKDYIYDCNLNKILGEI